MKLSTKAAERVIAFVLAAAISISSAFVIGCAEQCPKKKSSYMLTASSDKDSSENSQAVVPSGNDETVYVMTSADGTVKKVIVSSWLKNADGASRLIDSSKLDDVENAKTNSTYTIDSNGMRIWNADGKDIYSRGISREKLPIDIKVSYYLDGNCVSADDIAGKDGHVRIKFEYANNESRSVEINGKEETVYVPFVALTGMILDNDILRNITITDGKLINNGDNTVLIGCALPGLKESLNIGDELDIPSGFEIEADVKGFSVETIMTYVTNELFNEIDTDVSDIDLADKIDEITEASTALCTGSSKLYDGISKLLNKSDALIAGIDKLYDGVRLINNGAKAVLDGASGLYDGAKTLYDGSSELYNGAKKLESGSGALEKGAGEARDGAYSIADGASELKEGSGKLNDGIVILRNGVSVVREASEKFKEGLNKLMNGSKALYDDTSKLYIGIAQADAGLQELVNNNGKLTDGSRTIFENLLSMADALLEANNLDVPKLTIDNYREVLGGVIDSLSEENVRETAYRETIREQIIDKYRIKITEAVLESIGQPMTYDEYIQTVDARLQVYINDGTIDSEVEKAIWGIEELLGRLDSCNEFCSGLIVYTAGVSSVKDGTAKLTDGAGNLKDGAESLCVGTQKLYNASESLCEGTDALYNGIDPVYQGAYALYAGITALNDGSRALCGGLDTLYAGAGELNIGVNTLYKGSERLNGGMKKLLEGAARLKYGTASLYEGTDELYNSIGELVSGTDKMKDGVSKLCDGSRELSEGMERFDDECISKIADAAGGADELIERVRALLDISKAYTSFSGNDDIKYSKVRFIYKTESIG